MYMVEKKTSQKKRNFKKSWLQNNWKSVGVAVLVFLIFTIVLLGGMYVGYTAGGTNASMVVP